MADIFNTMWEAVIIGGGPVGLSLAKQCISKNIKTLLIEKSDKCGSEKRGETIDDDSIAKEIWGNDFYEKIVISSCNKNVFHSPLCKKSDEVIMLESPFIINWDVMINTMVDKLLQNNINNLLTIAYNTEVLSANIITANSSITSIKTSKGDIKGKTFFDCSGHMSPVGRQIGLNYSSIYNPILKARYNGYNIADSRFATYFIAAGTINTIDKNPPALLLMFPDGKGSVEIDMIVWNEYGIYGNRTKDEPEVNKLYIEQMWQGIKNDYLVISDIIKKLTLDYEFITLIPSKNMLHNAIYNPGYIFLGDSFGFLRADTCSGLIYGMKAASWWSNIASQMKDKGWDEKIMQTFNNDFSNSEIYKKIKSLYEQYRNNKNLAYGFLISESSINFFWEVIKDGYNGGVKEDALKTKMTDYKKMVWYKQAAVINGIIYDDIVGLTAEKKVTEFIEASKSINALSYWDLFLAQLNIQRLFKKMNTYDFCKRIFKVLGDSYKIDCFIAKKSLLYINLLTDLALKSTGKENITELIKTLIQLRPLFFDSAKALVNVLVISKSKFTPEIFTEIVNNAGGEFIIYKAIPEDKYKQMLDGIFKV